MEVNSVKSSNNVSSDEQKPNSGGDTALVDRLKSEHDQATAELKEIRTENSSSDSNKSEGSNNEASLQAKVNETSQQLHQAESH